VNDESIILLGKLNFKNCIIINIAFNIFFSLLFIYSVYILPLSKITISNPNYTEDSGEYYEKVLYVHPLSSVVYTYFDSSGSEYDMQV